MKKLTLIIAIIFSGMLMQAQEECTDVIYPAEGESIIFDCCIDEVKHGNIVYYTKDSTRQIAEAVAISVEGQYLDLHAYTKTLRNNQMNTTSESQSFPGLYKGQNYDYYHAKFRKATAQRGAGIFLTIFGFSAVVAGQTLMATESGKSYYDYNQQTYNTGQALSIGGSVLFNVGLPLWISGGVKRANNRRAMAETKRNMNLSLGTTSSGAGLTFNF